MYDIPFIVMNGVDVSIDAIQSNQVAGKTPFETATFDFIRDWLSGKEEFVIHTSGSTGQPKEIVLSRTQLQYSAARTVEALGLVAGDRALVCLNTEYIAGKMMLVRALERGLWIIAAEPSSNPFNFITSDVDFTALVPLQLEKILNAKEHARLNNMKAVIVGGAPVSDILHQAIQKIKAPVYATYGMTETISHIALQRLNGDRPTAYFSALPGIEIDQDARGCLVIKAPHLPEKIITNDVVEIFEGGKFRWLGRWDNVINTGGIKVMPEKIEAAIEKIFSQLGIHQKFFVHGIPDKNLGSKIILAVEGDEFSAKNDVIKRLHQTFSKYEIPKEIIFISQFVYTETGKVNRKKTLKIS